MNRRHVTLWFLTVATIVSVVILLADSHPLSKRAVFYIANETVCLVDGVVYHNGDPVPSDNPCEFCKCRPPGFACVYRSCEAKPGCKAVRKEKACCPDYICGCTLRGRYYEDGDPVEDPDNPCYACRCQEGTIACAHIDCPFFPGCLPNFKEGACCPIYTHCSNATLYPKPYGADDNFLEDSPDVSRSSFILTDGTTTPGGLDFRSGFDKTSTSRQSDVISTLTSTQPSYPTELMRTSQKDAAQQTSFSEEHGFAINSKGEATTIPQKGTEMTALPNEMLADGNKGDNSKENHTLLYIPEVEMKLSESTTQNPMIIDIFQNISSTSSKNGPEVFESKFEETLEKEKSTTNMISSSSLTTDSLGTNEEKQYHEETSSAKPSSISPLPSSDANIVIKNTNQYAPSTPQTTHDTSSINGRDEFTLDSNSQMGTTHETPLKVDSSTYTINSEMSHKPATTTPSNEISSKAASFSSDIYSTSEGGMTNTSSTSLTSILPFDSTPSFKPVIFDRTKFSNESTTNIYVTGTNSLNINYQTESSTDIVERKEFDADTPPIMSVTPDGRVSHDSKETSTLKTSSVQSSLFAVRQRKNSFRSIVDTKTSKRERDALISSLIPTSVESKIQNETFTTSMPLDSTQSSEVHSQGPRAEKKVDNRNINILPRNQFSYEDAKDKNDNKPLGDVEHDGKSLIKEKRRDISLFDSEKMEHTTVTIEKEHTSLSDLDILVVEDDHNKELYLKTFDRKTISTSSNIADRVDQGIEMDEQKNPYVNASTPFNSQDKEEEISTLSSLQEVQTSPKNHLTSYILTSSERVQTDSSFKDVGINETNTDIVFHSSLTPAKENASATS